MLERKLLKMIERKLLLESVLKIVSIHDRKKPHCFCSSRYFQVQIKYKGIRLWNSVSFRLYQKLDQNWAAPAVGISKSKATSSLCRCDLIRFPIMAVHSC